jgi:hypothetical protein
MRPSQPVSNFDRHPASPVGNDTRCRSHATGSRCPPGPDRRSRPRAPRSHTRPIAARIMPRARDRSRASSPADPAVSAAPLIAGGVTTCHYLVTTLNRQGGDRSGRRDQLGSVIRPADTRTAARRRRNSGQRGSDRVPGRGGSAWIRRAVARAGGAGGSRGGRCPAWHGCLQPTRTVVRGSEPVAQLRAHALLTNNSSARPCSSHG